MQIHTTCLGTVEYEQKDIVTFRNGLFGFENMTDYLLIHLSPDENSFLCLQSLQEKGLYFVLADPFFLFPDYKPDLCEEDLKRAELKEDTPVIFYTICVLKSPIEQSTCNLKAPLVIRTDTRNGFQAVLENPEYSFRSRFPKLSPGRQEVQSC